MSDNRPNAGIVYGLLAIFGICLIGVFGLAALGRDIGQVIYFVTPNLVLIGGILAAMLKLDKVNAKTDEQTEKLNQISGQVNGKLDRKFADLHDKIDAVHNQMELSTLVVPQMDINNDEEKGHNHD